MVTKKQCLLGMMASSMLLEIIFIIKSFFTPKQANTNDFLPFLPSVSVIQVKIVLSCCLGFISYITWDIIIFGLTWRSKTAAWFLERSAVLRHLDQPVWSCPSACASSGWCRTPPRPMSWWRSLECRTSGSWSRRNNRPRRILKC